MIVYILFYSVYEYIDLYITISVYIFHFIYFLHSLYIYLFHTYTTYIHILTYTYTHTTLTEGNKPTVSIEDEKDISMFRRILEMRNRLEGIIQLQTIKYQRQLALMLKDSKHKHKEQYLSNIINNNTNNNTTSNNNRSIMDGYKSPNSGKYLSYSYKTHVNYMIHLIKPILII